MAPSSKSVLPCVLVLLLGKQHALLSPAYATEYEDELAVLAVTGLVNRNKSYLWLNSSAKAPGMSVPVMWPYPDADTHWLSYLSQTKGVHFKVSPSAALCTLLADPVVQRSVNGLVIYEESSTIDALKFIATTVSGLTGGLPVTQTFWAHAVDERADTTHVTLDWAIQNILPNTTTRVIVAACRGWANYSCGWSDPLGSAAIDYAVQQRAFVFNLSPDAVAHPHQAARFDAIAAHLAPLGVLSGWAEPESAMVALLSRHNAVVQCGAPNLSFLASLPVSEGRLPTHTSTPILDPHAVYVVFQSNEGDTPKNAYSFRGGNWLSPSRGTVPIAWGVAPIIGDLFPGLWEYYVTTARANDQFFGATGGVGYTYPWSLPELSAYYTKAKALWEMRMPHSHNWVDMWEGGCMDNASVNPCLSSYAALRRATANAVDGFSQQPTRPGTTPTSTRVGNTWLDDGTPVFVPPRVLWYPNQNPAFCNRSTAVDALVACTAQWLRAVADDNPQRPLFVLAYGVPSYVDVATGVQQALAAPRTARSVATFNIIGVQDAAVLGRQPGTVHRTQDETTTAP